MQPDQESFEEAQNRILGRPPKRGRSMLRKLRRLSWWRVLRSAFITSFIFLFALRSIFEEFESQLLVLVGAGLAIFTIVTIIYLAIELGRMGIGDGET
jgi:hypothetical protein